MERGRWTWCKIYILLSHSWFARIFWMVDQAARYKLTRVLFFRYGLVADRRFWGILEGSGGKYAAAGTVRDRAAYVGQAGGRRKDCAGEPGAV
jgi:hypothetical protein